MVFVEAVFIIGIAGLVSSCAICGYPWLKKLRGEEPTVHMLVFTQGQCGKCLLPHAGCDNSQIRIDHNIPKEEKNK